MIVARFLGDRTVQEAPVAIWRSLRASVPKRRRKYLGANPMWRLKLVHEGALAELQSSGNTAQCCVLFKLCWGCRYTGLWLCYHSRVGSTQEVSFRAQTPSDMQREGTSIFACLPPSATSCISFPKWFGQHGTKWEKVFRCKSYKNTLHWCFMWGRSVFTTATEHLYWSETHRNVLTLQ